MKRFCIYILIAALLLGMFVVPAHATDSMLPTPPAIPTKGDVWDGVTITQPSKIVQKDGVNYYEISTCAELAFISNTGGDWLGRNYLLSHNLIFNNMAFQWDAEANLITEPSELRKWTPIGNSETNCFTGTLDGAGYSISGLFINEASDYIGLIGFLGIGGTVKNITIVNSYFSAQRYAGGIAGASYGNINNCIFSGVINIGHTSPFWSYFGGIAGESYGMSGNLASVTDCTNFGIIIGNDEFVGGIAGGSHFSSEISRCMNYGNVIGNTYVGGIIGGSSSSYPVDECSNYGTIFGNSEVGGIVGCAYSSFCISRCANYGPIVGKGDYIGGIVGYNSNDHSKCTNEQCSNYGAVSGENNVGGIAGYGSYKVLNSYNNGLVSGKSNVGGILGLSANIAVTNCYNTGQIECHEDSVGAIIGSDGAVWGKDTIIGCYYLRSEDLYGCGGVDSIDMEPTGFNPKIAADMKIQATYDEWNFTSIWRINPKHNDGYPYLAMENGLPGALEEAVITAPSTVASGLVYNGSAQALITAGTATGGTMVYSLTSGGTFTETIPTGTDAGSYTVYYKVQGDKNHTDTAEVSVAGITIAKAAYGDKTASGSAKFGQNGTVALNTLLADGYAVGTVTTTDEGLFDSIPALVGTELEFTFAPDAEAGKTATVTIPVTGATNYEPYTITVMLTVLDKEAQTLSFAEGSQIKTYGDADFTNAAANTGDGLVYYVSSDTKIATVDYNTGKVTILKVGEVTITAAADETADCFAASPVSYTLAINPKAVKITGLTAADKVYDGTTTVTVSGAAEVDGLVGDDEVAMADGTAAFADKNVGEDKAVTFTGYSLGGQDAANYTLSEQPSGITASITAKSVTATVTAVTRAYEKGNTTVELAAGAVTGALSGDTVAVDVTAAKGTLKDDNAGTGKPVAVTGVKLSGADAMNYTLENQPAGITATINKIAYDGSTFASGSAKAGKTGTVDLGELIAEGGSVGDITTSDGALFQRDPSVSGTTLSFTFASTAESGSSATITVPVENATNYLDYSITVNVTVEEQQSDSSDSGSGGSGSGGSGSSKTYSATITDTEHGTVTLKPKSPSSGTKVTIIATPDEGYEVAFVKVTDSNGKEVKVTANADGSYSFTQPSRKVTIEVTFTSIEETESSENTTPAPTENPFADVPENVWYYEAVMYCYEHSYFKGTGEDTFDPQGTMTRAMFVTVLYRIAGEPTVTSGSPFKDVDSGLWYSDAIAWASSEGIISGYEDGSFGTNDPVTREQIAVLLWRLMGKPSAEVADLTAFTDAGAVSDWARDAIAWAVSVGLLKGNGDGTLNPSGTATRAEVAQIVMNFDTTVK